MIAWHNRCSSGDGHSTAPDRARRSYAPAIRKARLAPKQAQAATVKVQAACPHAWRAGDPLGSLESRLPNALIFSRFRPPFPVSRRLDWKQRRLFTFLVAATTLAGLVSGCTRVRRFRAHRHVVAGEHFLQTDQLDSALTEFQTAARLDPQLAVAHSKMGTIYRRRGEYELAIDSFVEALRRNPMSFDDTFNLGQLYHFTKRLAQAIQTYLHAIELDPESYDAQLNLGVCYQQTGEQAMAIEHLRKAIRIDSDTPHAFVNLGVALDAQGRYYEAIRAFNEAIERDPAQPQVLVNLARTYMHQDRNKIARLTLQEAIRIDPSVAASHEALGYCLFKMRDFRAAQRAYQQALTYDDRLPRAHAGLGSIYMVRYLEDDTRLDLRDLALEHWHRSLEENPNQPRIRKLIARYQPKDTSPDSELLSAIVAP